jgi:hypothetical protein
MPRVSVWFVRSALVCLALGFTLGAVMLAAKGTGDTALVPRLLPIHVELLLVGWMLQLAMGVAQWILPRFGVQGVARGVMPAWIAFTALNGGLLLVAVAAVRPGSDALVLAGRGAEVVAAAAFVTSVWARVRASGLSAM